MSDAERELAMSEESRYRARQVAALMQKVRGLWVKIAQYMSSRADIFPTEWVEELRVLQDEMPSSPYSHVESVIRSDLKASISDLFIEFNEIPVASASIAQVHRAKRRTTGEAVAVKVQHKDINKTIRQDLKDASILVKIIARLEPTFDFQTLLDEWTMEVVKELDFVHEASNLRRARSNLKRAKMDVIVPTVCDDMVSENVLVMSWEDGVRINDVAVLRKQGVDLDALLSRLCHSFASQIFCDGFFNCDPHPGNLLVLCDAKKGVATPVLLDFGMTKELTEEKRLAFCNMVVSVAAMDSGGLLKSFEAMGLKLNREDPMGDMQALRFTLRETGPPKEMRRDTKEFRAEIKKKSGGAKLRNPVDAWPGELVFFFRVIMLLRGLCSRLEVRMPYMEILATHARRAVVNSVPATLHATTYTSGGCGTPVENAVRQLLLRCHGEVQGIQISVYHHGKMVVDVAGGIMGETDPRAVRQAHYPSHLTLII